MRERVYLQYGKNPIIFVAPHGADDTHTISIAKEAANITDGFAVINQGFERSDQVDSDEDQANCNRVDHLQDPVVHSEFLKPLLKFQEMARKKIVGTNDFWGGNVSKRVMIYHIHGAGNSVHSQAGERVEVIVGYGLGKKKDSLTCTPWRVALFVEGYRRVADQGEVFEAGGGSPYAGRSSNNLNQYFRKHYNDALTDSLQLEFPFSTRKSTRAAKLTAAKLAAVALEQLKAKSHGHRPTPKFI